MSYDTPHNASDYLKAAVLGVCHQRKLDSLGRSKAEVKKRVGQIREIDLCAGVADFFGMSAKLAAQGTSDIDLKVDSPVIRAEVKFPIMNRSSWAEVRKDLDWLLDATNAGNEFDKKAWIVFWPSIARFTFQQCLSSTRDLGTKFSNDQIAPFLPYTTIDPPAKKRLNDRLTFDKNAPRISYLKFPHGKTVKVELVGGLTHPVWCALYTRCVSTSVPDGATTFDVNSEPALP